MLLLNSEFVEGDDIDRLNIVFKGLNSLGNEIGWALSIFDGGTNLDLENTESNGFLLPLGLPEKTIDLDSEDLVGKSLQVGLLTPGFDIPDDKGLGNGSGLDLLGLSSISLSLHGCRCGGCLSWVLFSEKVHLVLFSGGSGLGFGLSLSLLTTLSFLTLLCNN